MSRPTWLVESTPPLAAAIIERARDSIGVCEDPLGSNSSPEIDAWLKRFGVPPRSPWCAAWLANVFRDAGAAIPGNGPDVSSCDRWMRWAQEHALWTRTPTIGGAVIYGKGEDAQHCGVVARLTPMVLTIEGNRGFGPATAEGVAVDLGPVSQGWVLGYVRPVAA